MGGEGIARLCGDGVTASLLEPLAREAVAILWQPADGSALELLGKGAGVDGAPLAVVLAGVDEERLTAALKPPVVACMEAVGQTIHRAPHMFRPGTLSLSLSTAAAYRLEPARLFCEALDERIGLQPEVLQKAELALHEAMVNAIIHGNLEIGALPKETLDDFMHFCQKVENRLGRPGFGDRSVHMWAVWTDKAVDIVIEDEGPGYDAASVPVISDDDDPNRKSGRGLWLIRDLAEWAEAENEGRRMTMRFPR